MNFVLVEKLVVTRTVKVLVPDHENPDAYREQTFKAVFNVVPADEAREMDKAYLALPAEEREAHEHDFLRRALAGWEGVEDASGNPVTFTPAALDQALKFPWFAKGVYAAYRDMATGARAGN